MFLEENEVSESIAEWSQDKSKVKSVEKDVKNVSVDIPEIAALHSESATRADSRPAEYFSAYEAMGMQTEQLDMRPYLLDSISKEHILLDSGSQVCAWPPDPGDVPDPRMSLKAANNSKLRCYGVKEVEIQIGRKTYQVSAIKTDVSKPILGWNFTRKHRLHTGWTSWGDMVLIDKKAKTEHILKYRALPEGQVHRLSVIDSVPEASSSSVLEKSVVKSSSRSAQQTLFEVASMEALDAASEEAVVENDIEKVPDGPYKELIKKFPDLIKLSFSSEEPKNGVIHRIDVGDNKPCRAKVRRYPPGSPKAVEGEKAIKELEKLGIIERVDKSAPNTFTSPLHLVPKPNGSLRPVGDFRLLNLMTTLDLFPLPNLRSFTDKIAGSKVFSKVDMIKAFHQIVIDPRDRHKVCITTPWGLFNFKRLAMGMQNSAQSFQRLVSDVLKDVPNIFVYLDDILVFTKSEEEHLKVMEILFEKLNAAGLTLALSKCEFAKPVLHFLGYEVSEHGIAPIPKKVEAISKFPVPTKQKQLLGFLGSLNYYRASLPSLDPDHIHKKARTPAQILEPLYKLATCEIPKKSSFSEIWQNSKAVQEAFKDAKLMLNKAVTLNFPDPAAPLAITTDASKLALGATLDQLVDGVWKPLGMWSKSLSPTQQKYTTFRRELMAVQLSMRHFNEQFAGRHLVIFSDHKPLVGSMNSNELQKHDPQAMNALIEIGQFTSDIRHKPGKNIPVADWLSRPVDCPIGKEYDVIENQLAEIKYVPPEATLAALQHVAMETLNPADLAEAQKTDSDCISHQKGHLPKKVKVATVRMTGVDLLCEVSNPDNPRPIIPKSHRDLIANLFHHGDHPGIKESLRRCSREYYWPSLKKDITNFVKSCHPCQQAKQSRTVDPGIGDFPVPDKRFQHIHLDVVGPLPESDGHKFLLTIYDRCSRWTEAYPLRRDSSEEVSKAFLQFISRFGLPCLAVSDNGNCFISNLFQDILKSFGIKVNFTPAYHAATNGAIERKHQDIKNALKAALVEMGDKHREKWMSALPWVMLGQRVKYQPNLDASAAQMVLQMSPRIPGQLLGHPGPPLNSSQTRALLDQLYRLADRPPVPTSGKRIFNDISHTEDASHVYVKVDKPESLCPKFEGPYAIISRPSRSTVEVKLGLYKSGEVRKQVYHWSQCKVASMRDDTVEAVRPQLGRPPKFPNKYPSRSVANFMSSTSASEAATYVTDGQAQPVVDISRGNQNGGDPPNSNPPSSNPSEIHEAANPSSSQQQPAANSGGAQIQNTNTRPVRTSRNKNPAYR